MLWRTPVRRPVAPVASETGPVTPHYRPRPEPGVRRMPSSGPPACPSVAVEENAAARAPAPAPAAPTPRTARHGQPANPDACPKRHYRRPREPYRPRHEHHGRVVHGHVHHLRIRRLNDDRLRRALLHLHSLLRGVRQISRRIGKISQPLNRLGHRGGVGLEGNSDPGKVVNVLRHHPNDARKGSQRNERRVEALPLRGIGQVLPRESRILRQPGAKVQNLLRIGRCCRNLCQQRIWKQRHWR